MKRTRGFTLIELLIVITILGVLTTYMLPNIVQGGETANHFACQRNLGKIHALLIEYKGKKQHYPMKSGVKFLLAPWTDGICERSETNRDYFFCPSFRENDAHLHETIRKTPLEDLWLSPDRVTSLDSHYAGRRRGDADVPMNIGLGNACIASDDNEHGSNHPDKNVNMLFGDGSVRQVLFADLQYEGLVKKEDPCLPVGPESPHKPLRQLSRN